MIGVVLQTIILEVGDIKIRLTDHHLLQNLKVVHQDRIVKQHQEKHPMIGHGTTDEILY